MISSEVQRTLVKSAPELWAELSDPTALARHLGELGQIRITRVDPEQKVEWVADDGDTSGTVIIKSSGWGTKVKLTLTRETSAPERPAEAQLGDGPVLDPERALAGDPTAVPDSEPNAITIEVETEPEPAESELEPPYPEAETQAEYSEAEPQYWEPEPVYPEAEAASPDQEAAYLEPEPVYPEAAYPELEPAESDGPSLELAPDLEPEPRRGFFARLFGRFRTEAVAGDVHEAPASEADPIDPASSLEDLDEPAQAVAVETSAPRPSDAHSAWSKWAEPSEPSEPYEPSKPSEPSGTTRAAAAEPEPEPLEVIEALPELDHEAQPEPPRDIAAEIRDAEEVAAEQVTAVLTGVLDRLGAAHHRPFSRA